MTTPLITDQLNTPDSPPWIGYTVKFLFMTNLALSYPLVLYPAMMINENYLFDGWEKSKKRQTLKNLNRLMLTLFITLFTIVLGQKIDKFLAILGALSCTPVAFLCPALFHLKLAARTNTEKNVDIFIICIALGIVVYCTFEGLVTWNEE